MGFIKKLLIGAAAVVTAPIVAPVAAAAGAAALGAAAAAGTAAAGAVAAAGTAAAGAAAAAGTVVAGAAGAVASGVTAAGTAAASAAGAVAGTTAGAIGTAAGTVGSAIGAAGTAIGGVASTTAGAITSATGAATSGLTSALGAVGNSGLINVARTVGQQAGRKVLVGAAVTGVAGVAYQVGKDSGYEEGHRDGHKSGFENGYKKGGIDTAKKFNESVEHHINRVASLFALGLYIGDLDGTFDEDDKQAIVDVLGDPKLQEEYVQKELSFVFQNRPKFRVIKKQYLDKLSFDDLNEFDEIIREIIYADGEPDAKESNFYNTQWRTYLNRRAN